MPMNKPHLEFHKVDLNQGWATPPGYPAGIQQKILASDLDETRKMGSRTRLLRFEPGVYTTAPFVHDHWEEVYLLSGDLVVGNDKVIVRGTARGSQFAESESAAEARSSARAIRRACSDGRSPRSSSSPAPRAVRG